MQAKYALYSVPSDACEPGQKVRVRIDPKLVKIYRRGRLLKVHPRQADGKRATDPDDLPVKVRNFLGRDPEPIRSQARRLGDAVGEFADRLLSREPTWAQLRAGHHLISLGERFGPEALEEACRVALPLDLIQVNWLERVLLNGPLKPPDPDPDPPPPGRFARPGHAFAVNGSAHGASGHRGGRR